MKFYIYKEHHYPYSFSSIEFNHIDSHLWKYRHNSPLKSVYDQNKFMNICKVIMETEI